MKTPKEVSVEVNDAMGDVGYHPCLLTIKRTPTKGWSIKICITNRRHDNLSNNPQARQLVKQALMDRGHKINDIRNSKFWDGRGGEDAAVTFYVAY
jgi:hypothetical protein